MNREAQATKQALMPTTAKTCALRGAKLFVVWLKRLSGELSREPWLLVSFGFGDMPSVWNIGRLVVKPLFSLFQLLHHSLEECGQVILRPYALLVLVAGGCGLASRRCLTAFGMMQCQRVHADYSVYNSA